MLSGVKDRYGPYPKKREKRRTRLKERRIRNNEWLTWKRLDIGGLSFYVPCSVPLNLRLMALYIL